MGSPAQPVRRIGSARDCFARPVLPATAVRHGVAMDRIAELPLAASMPAQAPVYRGGPPGTLVGDGALSCTCQHKPPCIEAGLLARALATALYPAQPAHSPCRE